MVDGQPLIHRPLVWSDAWILGCQFSPRQDRQEGTHEDRGLQVQPSTRPSASSCRFLWTSFVSLFGATDTCCMDPSACSSAHFVEWHMDLLGCKFNPRRDPQEGRVFSRILVHSLRWHTGRLDCTDRLVQVCTGPNLGLRPSSAKHRCNPAGPLGVR